MAETVPDRTYVSFILSGPELAPDFWTSYFGVQPDTSAVRGGDYVARSGKRITSNSRRGLWIVTTKGRVDSLQVDDHIDFLNSHLNLSGRDIQSILAARAEMLLFSCFVANYQGQNNPSISENNKHLIAHCGGRIEFDVYPQHCTFVGPDGKETDVIV